MSNSICGEEMILISHRGNIEGKSNKENSPEYIDMAIQKGYDVEVDLRIYEEPSPRPSGRIYRFFLGHDTPDYEVSYKWLEDRRQHLWIHCKNIESLSYFSYSPAGMNWKYFWHQEDDYTLVSNRLIWAYPGKDLTDMSICVMPELSNYKEEDIRGCFGICSDYVGRYK